MWIKKSLKKKTTLRQGPSITNMHTLKLLEFYDKANYDDELQIFHHYWKLSWF